MSSVHTLYATSTIPHFFCSMGLGNSHIVKISHTVGPVVRHKSRHTYKQKSEIRETRNDNPVYGYPVGLSPSYIDCIRNGNLEASGFFTLITIMHYHHLSARLYFKRTIRLNIFQLLRVHMKLIRGVSAIASIAAFMGAEAEIVPSRETSCSSLEVKREGSKCISHCSHHASFDASNIAVWAEEVFRIDIDFGVTSNSPPKVTKLMEVTVVEPDFDEDDLTVSAGPVRTTRPVRFPFFRPFNPHI